jgi:ADP-ribose pyrophosphatase
MHETTRRTETAFAGRLLKLVREETGYAVADLRKLGVVFTAPGYTDERLHLFAATLAPERGAMSPEEDEKLQTVFLTEERFEELLRCGEISDAKTLAAWLLWKAAASQP